MSATIKIDPTVLASLNGDEKIAYIESLMAEQKAGTLKTRNTSAIKALKGVAKSVAIGESPESVDSLTVLTKSGKVFTVDSSVVYADKAAKPFMLAYSENRGVQIARPESFTEFSPEKVRENILAEIARIRSELDKIESTLA